MNKTNKYALKASIAKWMYNSTVTRPEQAMLSSEQCPLCMLHRKRTCEKCPVKERTKQELCGGSPYEAACVAHKLWCLDPSNKKLRTKFHDAALEEAAFLTSLLSE